MGMATIQPTTNTTPDGGQAGTLAVTGASDTGHATTQTSVIDENTEAKSCICEDFPTFAGARSAVTLKVDYEQDGVLSAPANNLFTIEYSVNGGTNWTTLHSAANVEASSSATASASLSISQDTSQVQVRDTLDVSSAAGGAAILEVEVSNIRIEITYPDGGSMVG
jgi:hypothetical protein